MDKKELQAIAQAATKNILQIAAQEPKDRRTLSTLRECLTLPPEAFTALLKAMQATKEVGGLIARAASRQIRQGSCRGSVGCATAHALP